MAEGNEAGAKQLQGRTLKGKWRLEAQLGSGGMASVWSARHRNGKRVAIKLLHLDMTRDEAVRRRFLREGYLANKVKHPGVVTVLDDDDDGELVFLVMELLEGQTLSDPWKKSGRRLPLPETLRITDAVLDVLAAAHAEEITHRDVKPANIFVLHDGTVKMLDFGIARLKEGAPGTGHTTRLGHTLGSPAFMSPEQARARWELVDARTDLWAMGAVMFSVLTGEFVHGVKSGAEMIIATATQPARSLRDVWPEAPDVVAAIVDRALAFDPADRWQDARAMQAAVRRAMQVDFDKPRQPVMSLPDISEIDAGGVPDRPPFAALAALARARPVIVEAPEPAAPPEPESPESPEPAASEEPVAAPPSDSTTSAAVAAEPEPKALGHRSVRSTAVLGAFIALGLIGGGVAIGLLTRRTVVVSAPAASAPLAIVSAAPAPTPSVSASASAAPTPTAEAAPTASAAPSASAAAPATSGETPRRRPRPAPRPPAPPERGRYNPKTL